MSIAKTVVTALGALALSVSLVACGGGDTSAPAGPAPEEQEQAVSFVGSWELDSAEFSDGSYTSDDVDDMADLGLTVTLDLSEDGSATIDMFGSETLEGTWEESGSDGITITVDGEPIEATYDGTLLTLTNNGETMSFAKVSDTPGSADADDGSASDPLGGLSGGDLLDDSDSSGEMAELFEEDSLLAQDVYASSVTKTAELNVTVADDDTARITVVGIGEDYEGDTGYLIEVENRTDTDFVVGNATTELGGVDVYDDATFVRPVKAGETALGFFFFDQDVATVTADSSCEASFAILDVSDNLLGVYTMSL